MSGIAARFLLSIAVLFGSFVFYVVALFICHDNLRTVNSPVAFPALLMVHLATAVVFVFAWVALWLWYVRWTVARAIKTVLAMFCALIITLVSFGVFFYFEAIGAGWGFFFSVHLGILAFVVSTALIWRETDADRTRIFHVAGFHVPICQECGYNLAGIVHWACPVCGRARCESQNARSRETTPVS